ncbi:uncharacterized protein L3040_004672 [Drepanopeziza brunnea f. sp. 'multigermtubi']|uniref:uncharacterized protein n=1 Tax=Drepanopeziza brunnea f. sp. 'multigermtubi' TaxID=698441 RepID=UPI002398D099|nr:hypothetical protein L3040_004672 [Drepanopeziza brunnea f. sp. 'multigermtubi']
MGWDPTSPRYRSFVPAGPAELEGYRGYRGYREHSVAVGVTTMFQEIEQPLLSKHATGWMGMRIMRCPLARQTQLTCTTVQGIPVSQNQRVSLGIVATVVTSITFATSRAILSSTLANSNSSISTHTIHAFGPLVVNTIQYSEPSTHLLPSLSL